MGLIVRKYSLIKSLGLIFTIFGHNEYGWYVMVMIIVIFLGWSSPPWWFDWFLTYLLCSHRLPCTVLWRQPDKDNDDGFWWLLLLMMMMILMISKQWLLITGQWEKTHISCLLSENEAQTAVIWTINDATGNSVSPENANSALRGSIKWYKINQS